MVTKNNERAEALTAILGWYKSNLVLDEVVSFDREKVATNLGHSLSYVAKSALVLVKWGYLEYKKGNHTALGKYKLLKPLSDVTPEILNRWIGDYQREINQSGLQKKIEKALETREAQPSAPELPTESPKTLLKSSFTSTPTNVSTETTLSQPGAVVQPQTVEVAPVGNQPALTPMQQLLQQVQMLAEAEQKREEKQSEPTEELSVLDGRLGAVECKLTAVLRFVEQATKHLWGFPAIELDADPEAPAEEAGPPSTRTLLIDLVNSYAAAERRTEHDTWKYLYGQLSLRSGFNPYRQASAAKTKNYLTVVEQHGHLDTLFALAKKLLVLPDLK